MITKLFFCLPVRRNLFFKTRTPCRSNFSALAESNVTDSNNAPSQNLFLHFITNRFDISTADAAKMLKRRPALRRLRTLDNVEQLVSMLNRYGFAEDQIGHIIKCQPSLISSVERVLEPKIQLLKDFVVCRETLTKMVTRSPLILCMRLETLRCNVELLKTVSPTQDILIRAIARRPRILANNLQKVLKPSIAFWEDFGFRGTELPKFLFIEYGNLTRTSLTTEQLHFIHKTGIPKESKTYKYIVSIVVKVPIEVLKSKIDNLKIYGFLPEEAWGLVRRQRSILELSDENVKTRMDFMLNHMKLSVDFVAKYPRLFTMSLDKVIKPRILVLQTMTAMNGAGEFDPRRLYTMLMMTEAKFVAQIIEGHRESVALRTVYRSTIANFKSSKIKSF